jgi:group I intron endonuclease
MSERTYCVYKHTNKVNGKVYIGITSKSPERRWSNGIGYKANKHFWNAIQKYGWDGFSHEILFCGLSEEEAREKEIDLIDFYGSCGENGYNLTIGGEGSSGWKMTDEQKAKISEAHKGKKRPPHIAEMVRARSLGKKASPGARRKMSEARTGKVHTDETKQKLSKIMKDRGFIPYAAIEAAAQKHKRPVAQYTIGGELVKVWPSAMDAEREGGFTHNSIAGCARGRIRHHKGFVWQYIQ